jgi:prevent-host-death family protein
MPIAIINIHEAKTQLSKLVELAAAGREFIIAKAGKPMVRVVPLAQVTLRPLGGLSGQSTLTIDLKNGFATDIEAMFDHRAQP